MRFEVEQSPSAESAEWLAALNARMVIDNARRQQEMQDAKLQILAIMLERGIARLEARASGSGDSGLLDSVECVTEPAADSFELCETPEGIEDLVNTILDNSSVNFNNDGGFFNLTITAATRECAIEIGWYETVSDSNTETETL